jgi:pSer/pThr/pTyr-binding forkhead associated (FHA) protein
LLIWSVFKDLLNFGYQLHQLLRKDPLAYQEEYMTFYDDEPTMMGHGHPSAMLVIRQGPQAGMSFPLSGHQAVIGREEGLDIVLQDPEASRRHARIGRQAGQFFVEDMGSTNGTFVNGLQITVPQILNPGDSIGIGQTALVFQIAGAQIGTPQYQPPPQQVVSYRNPAEAGSSSTDSNKALQYVLYGCGCLLLICICSLLAIAAWALLDPASFESIFVGASVGIIQTYFQVT